MNLGERENICSVRDWVNQDADIIYYAIEKARKETNTILERMLISIELEKF